MNKEQIFQIAESNGFELSLDDVLYSDNKDDLTMIDRSISEDDIEDFDD